MRGSDNALGLNERICRRDFLNSTLLASGSLLLKSLTPIEILAQMQKESDPQRAKEWNGPSSGVGDYQNANGDPWEVMSAGHAIRDGVYDTLPAATIDTGEVFDCVVVGGGISGLAAALTFKKEAGPGRTCLVLENHAMFGGEARRNEFIVDGQRVIGPQGSGHFGSPDPDSFEGMFLDQIGLDWRKIEWLPWGGPDKEMVLSRTSYSWLYIMPPTFGLYFFGEKSGQRPGKWVMDPWGKNLEGIPYSAAIRSDMLKWWKASGDSPMALSGDARSRYLDSITQEDRIVQETGLSREMVRTFLSPLAATGWGLGCDALSGATGAWGYWYHMTMDEDKPLHSFPGGNTGIARFEVKALIPDAIEGPATLKAVVRNRVNFQVLDRPQNPVRIRLRSTVVRVEHERDPQKSSFVWVTYTRDGKTYRLKARSVVMASGGYVNRHIIRDLPNLHREAYSEFYYAAHLSMNIAVRHWRFLYKLGISGAHWFDGFGVWTEVRDPMTFGLDAKTFGPDSPTVLTLYTPFFYPGLPTGAQGDKGRMELMSNSFRDFERKVREQFVEMFSRSGFDPKRDIAGIVLNRWGHAFITPGPGFFYGKGGKPAPYDVFRNKPFGRIAFGHSDTAGEPSHSGAIHEGQRAAKQVVGILGS